jgi:DNA-binding Xre family transcriptional regulator
MATNYTAVSTATKRNILLGILDKGTSRTATAAKAGISSSTFHRKLSKPEQFTLEDLGNIAQALEMELTDLLPTGDLASKDAA